MVPGSLVLSMLCPTSGDSVVRTSLWDTAPPPVHFPTEKRLLVHFSTFEPLHPSLIGGGLFSGVTCGSNDYVCQIPILPLGSLRKNRERDLIEWCSQGLRENGVVMVQLLVLVTVESHCHLGV